ncbi:MAG: hypothetical protein ACO3JL_14415, partial [Myxococcota bacterium]
LQTAYQAAADSSLPSLAGLDSEVFGEVDPSAPVLPATPNSVVETAMWSPAEDEAGLEDLLGDDPPELEGTVTSRVGPATTGFTADSFHSAPTGRPAALPPAAPMPPTAASSYDPFADVSLGPLPSPDVESFAGDDDGLAWGVSADAPSPPGSPASVVMHEEEEEEEEEVTAALAPLPLARPRPEAGLLHSEDDVDDPEESEPEEATAILSEYPRPPAPPPSPTPSARTDARGELLDAQDIHDLATAAPRSRQLSDASQVPTGPRPGRPPTDSSEEIIDDDLVIRPAGAAGPPPPPAEATHILVNPLEAPPAPGPQGVPERSEAASKESAAHPSTEMQAKARRLFEEALRDHREGRIGAARMNAKLATIYDPAEETYAAALEEWASSGRAPRSAGEDYAVLYDGAQSCEAKGDIAGALQMLEQGVSNFPDIAAFHNRLGVLLAIHRREYDRAAASIQRAIELDPENLHYKSNLGKIVSRSKHRGRQANA